MIFSRMLAGAALMAATLLGGVLAMAHAAAPSSVSTKERVEVGKYTVSFALPNLAPSKDFPPTKIDREIDPSKITGHWVIMRGHWEGVRRSRFAANGLLDLWLDISPWPEAAATASTCREKARFVVQQLAEVQKQRAELHGRAPPNPEITEVTIADRSAFEVRSLYADYTVKYAIPVDEQFYLTVITKGADGSGANSWLPRANDEVRNFLQSLEIASGTCPEASGAEDIRST